SVTARPATPPRPLARPGSLTVYWNVLPLTPEIVKTPLYPATFTPLMATVWPLENGTLFAAVMVTSPPASVAVVMVAPRNGSRSSKNSPEPVGVPPRLVTVAVRVTELVGLAVGLGLLVVTVVVVELTTTTASVPVLVLKFASPL